MFPHSGTLILKDKWIIGDSHSISGTFILSSSKRTPKSVPLICIFPFDQNFDQVFFCSKTFDYFPLQSSLMKSCLLFLLLCRLFRKLAWENFWLSFLGDIFSGISWESHADNSFFFFSCCCHRDGQSCLHSSNGGTTTPQQIDTTPATFSLFYIPCICSVSVILSLCFILFFFSCSFSHFTWSSLSERLPTFFSSAVFFFIIILYDVFIIEKKSYFCSLVVILL